MSRRFDEEEVALILREATLVDRGSEAESTDPLTVTMGEGLTLKDLKEIASEAGIDPLRVDQAARSLLARPRPSPFRVFLGTAAQLRIQSELPKKIDDGDLTEALFEIRSVMSVQGTSSGSPSTWEWVSGDELGARHVTIARTSTGTRLDVTGDFGNAARGSAGIGAAVAGVGAVGVAAAVASVGVLGWAVAPVVAVGVVLIPRFTVGRIVRRETRKLSLLARRLRARLSKNPADGDPVGDD